MVNSPITADSTKEEILEALREQGFDNDDGNATKEELLDLLSSVTGEDYSVRKKPSSRTSKTTAKKDETPATVKIIIPSNEGVHGKGDVYVGVNGRNFSISRDVEVAVPYAVYEILKNAKTKVGRPTGDGDVVVEEQQTYPFSVVV